MQVSTNDYEATTTTENNIYIYIYIQETTNNTTHDGLEKEVMHRTWL